MRVNIPISVSSASSHRQVSLLSDKALTINWMPGTSSRLVIVFTGMKHGMGDISMSEFEHTVSLDGLNNLIFVADHNLGYYSLPGQRQAIVDTISRFIAENGISETYAIGNSMGGFGALVLAGDLPIKASIAFSPSISLAPDWVNYPEWATVRRRMGSEIAPDAQQVMATSDTRFYLFFGTRNKDDNRQRQLLSDMVDRANVTVVAAPGVGHNISKHIKGLGMLTDLVRSVFFDSEKKASAVVEQVATALKSASFAPPRSQYPQTKDA